MYAALKAVLLEILRVPERPQAPAGSPESIRVFRAGANYYRYKLVVWAGRQIVAVVGAMIAFVFVGQAMDRGAARAERALERRPSAVLGPGAVDIGRTVVTTVEVLGFAVLLLQMPFTLAAVRLDYELRWYVATDRSLRIREGLTTVREMTLTFGNVQNVSVRQGPLQRLLGLADVVVETAGGGGSGGAHDDGSGPSLHEGVLHGVDNAEEVRDLILARLRRLRDAGLGDPEDRPGQHHGGAVADRRLVAAMPPSLPGAAVEAARELLAEATALRRVLVGRDGVG